MWPLSQDHAQLAAPKAHARRSLQLKATWSQPQGGSGLHLRAQRDLSPCRRLRASSCRKSCLKSTLSRLEPLPQGESVFHLLAERAVAERQRDKGATEGVAKGIDEGSLASPSPFCRLLEMLAECNPALDLQERSWVSAAVCRELSVGSSLLGSVCRDLSVGRCL